MIDYFINYFPISWRQRKNIRSFKCPIIYTQYSNYYSLISIFESIHNKYLFSNRFTHLIKSRDNELITFNLYNLYGIAHNIYLFFVTPSLPIKAAINTNLPNVRSYYIEEEWNTRRRPIAIFHSSFQIFLYCPQPLPPSRKGTISQQAGCALYTRHKQIPAWNKIRFSARWKKDIDPPRNPRAYPIIFTNHPKPTFHARNVELP